MLALHFPSTWGMGPLGRPSALHEPIPCLKLSRRPPQPNAPIGGSGPRSKTPTKSDDPPLMSDVSETVVIYLVLAPRPISACQTKPRAPFGRMQSMPALPAAGLPTSVPSDELPRGTRVICLRTEIARRQRMTPFALTQQD